MTDFVFKLINNQCIRFQNTELRDRVFDMIYDLLEYNSKGDIDFIGKFQKDLITKMNLIKYFDDDDDGLKKF